MRARRRWQIYVETLRMISLGQPLVQHPPGRHSPRWRRGEAVVEFERREASAASTPGRGSRCDSMLTGSWPSAAPSIQTAFCYAIVAKLVCLNGRVRERTRVLVDRRRVRLALHRICHKYIFWLKCHYTSARPDMRCQRCFDCTISGMLVVAISGLLPVAERAVVILVKP